MKKILFNEPIKKKFDFNSVKKFFMKQDPLHSPRNNILKI